MANAFNVERDDKVVFPRGCKEVFETVIAGTGSANNIKPGMTVKLDSSGTTDGVTKTDAADIPELLVAKCGSPSQASDQSTEIVAAADIDDTPSIEVGAPKKGDIVNLHVHAGSAAIVYGNGLGFDATNDGFVVAATANIKFKALEDLDLSSSTVDGRILGLVV